ncbi:MAG: phage tail protein [Candidatus Aminicenantes bacterium]|nr:phage tail protein [Candidatus Aminicenantes bacterium]NIM85007.1 phage tail protein [Candidatus Aminicenantes bacterium]NIN24521.1 phage tail protein [Candidatus Aminicenantes bacterium]NIN48285.1 phage tail protein [Candidatus Aminicenantes bacterium]NIN91188.1 phage tail protein [Candidatus Aminicenantes bacterium]
MAKFSVNTERFDPYRNFKFKIKWDGVYVAGLSKCSALKKTTESSDWREGGDPSTSRKLPGKTSYEAITMEAGVTHDATFEDWANLVNNFEGDASMSLKNFRKDVTIDVFNLQGSKVLSYIVHRCWVSEYQSLPELDASGNAVMIQTIKLENEGWERDKSVTEPTES